MTDYVLRILRILVDIYILVTFAVLSLDFLKIKLSTLDNKLTRFNYFIIFWVFFLTFLNFLSSLVYLFKNIYLRFQTSMG